MPAGKADAVIRAFGGDPASAIPVDGWGDDLWYGDSPAFAIRELSGAILVIEPNGYLGTLATSLAAASECGTAVSAFWNVDAMVRIASARNGVEQYNSEFMILSERNQLPAALRQMAALTDDSDHSWTAIALAMVESLTGIAITPDTIAETSIGYASTHR